MAGQALVPEKLSFLTFSRHHLSARGGWGHPGSEQKQGGTGKRLNPVHGGKERSQAFASPLPTVQNPAAGAGRGLPSPLQKGLLV